MHHWMLCDDLDPEHAAGPTVKLYKISLFPLLVGKWNQRSVSRKTNYFEVH